jgi:O-antigen/teichoic acid export membrane protein
MTTDLQTATLSAGQKPKEDIAHTHIRESSLLLSGRLLATGANFAAQVLIVRYLSTSDYGAWAYALSIVTFLRTLAPLGLDRAMSRFIPIYHEKHEYNKVFGTMLLVVGTILVVGTVFVAGFYGFPGEFARLVRDQQQPLNLLFILILLVPLESLDAMMVDLFASFGNPGAIFFRRYVLAPSLRLGVIVFLILSKSGAEVLAYGYVAASFLGVFLYGWVLFWMLRRNGLLGKFRLKQLHVPAREVLSFTIPLLTSDLVTVTMNTSAVLLLGYFHNLPAVALFRVALPLALLNRLVMNVFSTLYKPTAARLFARNDHKGINRLYWNSAAWIAALSFPILAVTFSLAKPLVFYLYGVNYAPSAAILSLLSLGYYFDAALGNNGLTLRVLGKVRYMVTINCVVCLVSVGLHLLFIPRYGALGAAISTSVAVVFYNILKQAGLRLVAGISLFDRQYAPFYLALLVAASGLLLVGFFTPPNIFIAAASAVSVSLLVLALCRKKLRVAETFPELVRLPLMRLIFA